MSLSASPSIGVAYSSQTPAFLARYPDAVDHVEIPFELLQHAPSVLAIGEMKPVILHCASLSVGGTTTPSERVFGAIEGWIDKTQTPWLGEHLSFITASALEAGPGADAYAPNEPYNIGYTVSPPLNEATIDSVALAAQRATDRLGVRLLLENPPIYFPVPGSSMGQIEFISELCRRSPVELLLDLAHFFITSETTGFDPISAVASLPLDRVVEVHISGVDDENGRWDNHARRAPAVVFELLDTVLRLAHVEAVTLEYNWSAKFPPSALLEEIGRTREIAGRVATAP
jgi:uncharacterized protein (UPF0276 family)